MSRLRTVRYILWSVVLLAGLGFGSYELWHRTRPVPMTAEKEIGRASIRSDFSLVDHTGRAVTDEDFRGKWLLVFFGYTYCPDVCPTTLNEIAEVMERLGEKAAKVQPLFITIDPERDTPDTMADYVVAFHPRIRGWTGSPEDLAQAAGAFRVTYKKVPLDDGGYTMDHTASVILFDATGEFRNTVDYHEPREVAVPKIRLALGDR